MLVSLVCDAFGFHGCYHGPLESFFRKWWTVFVNPFIHSVNTFEHLLEVQCNVLWEKTSLLHDSAHNKRVKNDIILSSNKCCGEIGKHVSVRGSRVVGG